MLKQTKSRRYARITALMMAATIGLSGCAGGAAGKGDVLTQKAVYGRKTTVSVLVKYAFSINAFEEALEAKFPNVNLIQVGNYTRDMGIAEYDARLEHGDITDIVMTWPLDVGEEYWDDRLLDLSGMEFTSRYNTSMLNDISRGGKLHYLPGPAQIRGIVYNKTLFKEKGWALPTDFNSFVELCQTIEQSGMRSIQLGFSNGEVLDTAFVGYNFGNYLSSPQDLQWIDEYSDGTGSFGDHFSGALDVFTQMRDAGIWKASDLEVDYSDRERMLFTRQCAMVEDSALMAKMGEKQTGTTDKFALMPFFNPGNDGDWARLYMVCYIGLNKQLAEPANKEKYDVVMDIMDYISTPEGQRALAADTGGMFSSLADVPPPDVPEIEALVPALSRGRYAVFPTLPNAQDALRKGLAGLLDGSLTKEAVIEMVDEQNSNPMIASAPLRVGSASEDFTLTETGNFIADTIRDWGESEIALFLDNGKDGTFNGKGVSGRLYGGEITQLDINRIMPDLKSNDNGALWKASISGENLLKTLENSVVIESNDISWFYYASGLKMELDPTAPSGSRVKKITTTDGKAVDPARQYTITVTEGSVDEAYLESCEKTSELSYDVITEKIATEKVISPVKDDRLKIVSSKR